MLNPGPFRVLTLAAGEQIEWLRALPCSCYDATQNHDEQRQCPLCEYGWVYRAGGTVRGLVSQQRRTVMHPEIGLVRTEELTLTTLPKDVRFGDRDKVVLLDRTEMARETLHIGGDTIAHSHLAEVRAIVAGTTEYTGEDYTVDLETGIITWGDNAPDNVYSVEYTYHPTYWYLGADLRPPRPTGFSEDTPQRGLLSLAPPPA